jgi:hypothetical protein
MVTLRSLKSAFGAAVVLWLSACGGSSTPTPADSTHAGFLKHLKYTVIEENRIPGIKLSLRVLLEEKASEDQLRSIAQEIRSGYPADFQRVFMVYYLPGMSTDGTAWATTHFDPDLQVAIIGPTAQQQRQLESIPLKTGDQLLGSWFDQSGIVGGTVRLIRHDGRLDLERHFMDGSSLTEHVRESNSSGARRLDTVEHNRFGEYYVIARDGSLEMYDTTGLIKTLSARGD